MARDSFMDLARDLAERGRYTASPNPLVGAVVVRDGRMVGEGFHVRPGEDHAEAMAIKASKDLARGATLYVTLEPCNCHQHSPGPSCVEWILSSGLRRVVVGHVDPNPWMDGRSIETLREAGVEVEVLEDPAFERQNEQFFWRKRTGRPFVHLKLAATLDGRIATREGDSRWVTGEDSRRWTHGLRAESGAVLVGARTARADDPMLNVRELPEGATGEPRRVSRVVLDPRVTLSPGSALARTAQELPVYLFADHKYLDGRERPLVERGVEVIGVPGALGGLDLTFVLNELGRRDASGVLVEGGGETARRFLERGLVNKMTLFYAPKLVGSEGVPMIGSLGVSKMAEAMKFRVSGVERFGEDVAVALYPADEAPEGTLEETKEEDVHRAG